MKIIYFMGKSASGKDTIYRKVKEKLNPSPKEIILYTTRPIRDHEENGREYFFVTDSEIDKMENEGKIIEEAWNMVPQNGATCPKSADVTAKSSTRIICF